MKNQRSTTEHKRFRLLTALAFMLMLAALVCCFTVSVSANGTEAIQITQENLSFAKSGDFYTKVYNGTNSDVTADFNFTNGTKELAPLANGDDVKVVLTSATLNSTDAGMTYVTVSFELQGADAGMYETPGPITIPALITPKTLEWADPNFKGTVNTDYVNGKSSYEFEIDIKDKINATGIVLPESVTARIDGVALPGAYSTFVEIDLGKNYTIAPLQVDVTINKIELVAEWAKNYEFTYGDQKAFNITVLLKDKNNTVQMLVPVKYRNIMTGDVGTYEIYVELPDDRIYKFATDADTDADLFIRRKEYKVDMNDATFVGDADHTANAPIYKLGVVGINSLLPDDILNLITYTANGAPFFGTSAYGETVVTATLPQNPNYYFTKNGQEVTSLQASLYISRLFIATGVEDDVIDVIVYGEKGFSADIIAKVEKPDFKRSVLRGYPIHQEFTLTLTGNVGDSKFVLLIPLNEKLYDANAEELTADNLYVYEPSIKELVKANTRYTVTIEDGYYKVEGYTGSQAITFVIAPEYNTPFWLTAPGIALIVLLVLAFLVLLFFIGLKRRADDKKTDDMTVDTVGEAYEGDEVVVDGEDAAPIVDVDALNAEAEEDAVDPEDAREAVDEAMKDLTDEAAAISLEEEDTTASADEVTDALADQVAENVADTAEEETDEADPDAVAAAVAETIDEAANESADATDAVEVTVEEEAAEEETAEEAPVEEAVEAFAAVEETEEDNNDDDSDEEDAEEAEEGFGGISTAGLKFIDIAADPDGYNEMLEQERQGLIQIVYRYRRSYMSRLAQSQGNVQDYYTAIKNLLLSYKGIKGRVSWNYEAFNRGRAHVAKLNAKTKTLYLYLALNPEELVGTKYGIVDMSAKKKYASVPVLMKIKGDRKFKYALELINKLCGEDLALKQGEVADVDYRMPYKTLEELVEEGVIKKFAAGISLVPAEEVAPEAAPEEEAPATEEEVVAVDAPVEETEA